MKNFPRVLVLSAVLCGSAAAQNQQVPIGPSGGGGGGGSGSVTSVSVVSANGISGVVANPTTTPAITLTVQNATNAQLGLAQCDGTTITCAGGVITAAAGAGPFLPLAGGTMVGTITASDGSTYGSTGLNGLTALGMSGTQTFTSGGITTTGTVGLQISTLAQGGANNAGALSLKAGNNTQASGTNNGGNLNLTAGNASGGSSTGNGGNVVLTAGTSVGGTLGQVGVAGAGTAALPAFYVGNTTTGLYSVSTTGLGFSVNGTVQLDYAITTGTVWTFAGAANFGGTGNNAIRIVSNTGGLTFRNGSTLIGSPANAALQFGAPDAASPVAQTLQVQSVVGGTANTAGVNWTQQASLSTGTGIAGLTNFLTGFASLSENATITATNASPGVITYTAHGLVPGASGQFSNSGGALPTGISAATNYFVCKDANYAVNTFDISLTFVNGACGTLINTSSTGSGTNTFTTNTTVQNPASTVVAVGPSGLTGSQTTSSLAISQTWNTSGTPTAIVANIINTASNNASLLINLMAGAAGTTTEFKVDALGNATLQNGLFINANGGTLNLRNGSTVLSSPATAKWQLGGVDGSAPVAQTLLAQSVAAGNANTAGVTTTIQGSLSNGSGGGGNIVLSTTQSIAASGTQNTALAGITILGGTQRVQINQITSDAALTDTTVCQDTTNHALFAGSGTAGICLGNVSSIRFKPDYALIADGLGVMNALDPGLYHYSRDIEDGDHPLRVGFTAERYATVLPQFTRYDADGRPNGVDMLAAFPFAVRAIQQLDERLSKLESRSH